MIPLSKSQIKTKLHMVKSCIQTRFYKIVKKKLTFNSDVEEFDISITTFDLCSFTTIVTVVIFLDVVDVVDRRIGIS